MRTRVVFFVLFLGLSSLLQAQEQESKKTSSFPSDEMVSGLQLTNEQVAVLNKAEADFKNNLRTLRAKSDIEKDQLKAEYAKLLAKRMAVIKTTLDKTQYLSYLEAEMLKIQMRGYKSFERMKDAISGGVPPKGERPATIPDGGGGSVGE